MTGDAATAYDRFPDANPNPVLRIGDDGRVAYANAAAAPILDAWAVAVGEVLGEPVAAAVLAASQGAGDGRIEVESGNRTFSVLVVAIPELDACQLYGTDITARKVVERFPARNPNPVMRLTPDGVLLYANEASRPVVEALDLAPGRRLPATLVAALQRRLRDPEAPSPEVSGSRDRLFTITPVLIPEFGFVNVYGTDITAVRQVERLHAENEALLLNILPRSIAARLRDGETVIADRLDDMAVLFADLVGFTELAAGLEPDEVVSLLNDVFTHCDRLADRFGLEKIKTVGDAYMVAGGLHFGDHDGHAGGRDAHALAIVDMGLAMLADLEALGAERGRPLRMRVGMHAGPAVAGVIGLKKFIYDVWGDTVNMASRMESSGVPGRLQVTSETAERLSPWFDVEPRGVVDVKGKGPIETWFVVGRRVPAPRDRGPAGAPAAR
jgi:class 3 adenylate cyclase